MSLTGPRTREESIKASNTESGSIISSINSKIKSGEKINLVCYIYDDMCAKHTLLSTTNSDGEAIPHQESRHRVQKINGALHTTGLGSIFFTGGSIDLKRSDLFKVHTKDYIKCVEDTCKQNKPVHFPPPSTEISITDFSSLESIYAAPASVMGAVNLVCVGTQISTQKLRESLAKNKKIKPNYISNHPKRVFCNVRPPGHHAHADHGAGFCFINNVAVGAKYALTNYPHIKKILIIDWDLHHGDGTQDIFKDIEDNSSVMYVSLHRGTDFYPGTGSLDDNTKYKNILNVPLKKNCTIDEYMHNFNNVVLPACYNYKPDLIMISAGFDSHKDDIYSELPLDYKDYSYMTRCIIDLAETCSNGRIVSVLEGGYSIHVLVGSVLAHVSTMIDYNGVKKN